MLVYSPQIAFDTAQADKIRPFETASSLKNGYFIAFGLATLFLSKAYLSESLLNSSTTKYDFLTNERDQKKMLCSHGIRDQNRLHQRPKT